MHRFALTAALGIGVLALTAWTASADADERFDQLVQQAQQAADRGDHGGAVELLDRAIAIDGTNAGVFRFRGRENFCSGNIEESIDDFDRVAKLAPNLEKTLWERGISQYYAGRFDDGAKQFELYQTYHDADVENAAWRYLCVARADGAAAARKSLLPIKNDRRVPMMKIYAMYKGDAEPGDVLAAAKAGTPNERQFNERLFYAHLYIGLFHEAAGQRDEAKKHIAAAVEHRIAHYMHDVARVHWERLQREKDE